MDAGDRSYMLSVLQSYKDHTKLGIEHFANKTTFTKMGGVTRLEMDNTEAEEIEGINKAAHDLLYYLDRFQVHLREQEKEYWRRRE